MPLPDADPDKRMYKLLKNIDLENLSFAQFQSTAQTVFAEPESEDTLRRIVLINLSRMAVAGDWNGLTTAGATQYALEPIDASQLTTYNYFVPWARDRTTSGTVASANMEVKAVLRRFIAPLTGTMGDITVRTTNTNTGKDDCKIAIYSSVNGLPGTRIGDISIDVNGGGGALYTSSSWVTAPDLTVGVTYWIGFAPEGATVPAISIAAQALYLELGMTHAPGTGYGIFYNNGGSNYDLPSSITNSQLVGDNGMGIPVWGFKYA